MTTLEKLVQALREAAASGADGDFAALAALKAIRMPTRHMIVEAEKRRGGAEHAADCWIRMIDAILNEKPDA